jgi:hypothetical protein
MRHRANLLVVSLAVAALLALAGCGGSSKDSTATEASVTPATTATTAKGPELGPPFGSMDNLPGVLKTAPPWDANTGKLQLRLRAIGLPALTAEGQVVHIHQHLDLFVGGKPVKVADDVGIDPKGGFISPLHTHLQTEGVLHVESPTASSFSLGQFFAVWGVRLDAKCLGGDCAGKGKELHAWVNGVEVKADPTRIVLAAHQEIVIAYGTPKQMPDPVPASYAFPAGL